MFHVFMFSSLMIHDQKRDCQQLAEDSGEDERDHHIGVGAI